jgi:hypothetical protein
MGGACPAPRAGHPQPKAPTKPARNFPQPPLSRHGAVSWTAKRDAAETPSAPERTARRARRLRRRPVCCMVQPAPVTRSGGGERFAVPCHPAQSLPPRRRGRGAEPVGAAIRRPAGHSPAFVDRGKVRARRSRVIARRAPHLARRGQSSGRAGLDPGSGTGRQSIHTGRRSHERTAPTPETDHRASPSRNGSPAYRPWRRGWHARRCILSPAGRAPSRKPFQPPDAARPIKGRATISGGTPEFRTE